MDIAEKRVYDSAEGRSRLAVATGHGLAVVGISADVIGEFGLAQNEPVRAVAPVGDGRLLVAAPEDLLVVALGEDGVAETVGLAGTGAGPTAAVTVADDAVIAAGTDGVVRRAPLSAVRGVLESAAAMEDGSPSEDGATTEAGSPVDGDAVAWTELGEATVRAADGRLLAADDGVYRVGERGIDHVGLDDVRDVAAPAGVGAGSPFAATADGLYRLGPGWTEERAGSFDLVAAADSAENGPPADGSTDSRSPRSHAGTADDDLLARTGGGWTPVEWPARSAPAGIAYGTDADAAGADDEPPTFAVAADGTVLADAGEGWRTRSIGLPDVEGCAVVR
jgi:hypothetical protein